MVTVEERDELALAMMKSLVGCGAADFETEADFARAAYRFADAFLDEREKQNDVPRSRR